MTIRKIVNGELRAYIKINKVWRHVYILASFDQMTIVGEPVRMIEFRLTKGSPKTEMAEKSKFYERKPVSRTQKRSEGA